MHHPFNLNVNTWLIVTIVLINFSCIRQDPIADQSPENTYALIIGVADYENVEDLEFADKDALAFKAFLKSKSGGEVPEENIKTFINTDANTSSIGDSIQWLVNSVEEGDRIYIFFAGHGDTESLMELDNGLLLLHKAPENSYLALGYEYLPISYLRKVVAELTIKKTEVILIIDACHSGELAGGKTGIYSTSRQLMEVWDSSVKLLSCQPDELSYEGLQWGDGHGVFSYYLMLGMGGLADENNNFAVDISELQNYLEKEVPIQTQPSSQTPVILGDINNYITYVDTTELLKMKRSYESQVKLFSELNPLSSAEVFEEYLQNQDTSIKEDYEKYTQLVELGYLIEPVDSSAYTFFKKLKVQFKNETLVRLMERNFIAALQDKAMSVIIPILDLKSFSKTINEVNLATRELELAKELLGEKHFMYESISIRKYFLEAYSLSQQYLDNKDSSLLVAAEAKLFSAIEIDSNAAYPYFQLGWIYNIQKQYKKALKAYQKYQQLVPNNPRALNNIGYAYNALQMFDSAIINFEKVIELDSNFVDSYNNIGYAYAYQENWKECAIWFEKATFIEPEHHLWHYNLGLAYKYQLNFEKAERCYKRSLELKPEDIDSWFNLACIYSIRNEKVNAINYLSIAIEFGYNDKAWLETDTDLDNIRDTQEFNKILGSLK